MNNEKILHKFKEFQNTFPEDMRNFVSPVSVIKLMQWAYNEGKNDK